MALARALEACLEPGEAHAEPGSSRRWVHFGATLITAALLIALFWPAKRVAPQREAPDAPAATRPAPTSPTDPHRPTQVADAVLWQFAFRMFGDLPDAGTATFILDTMCGATTGNIHLNIQWASVAIGQVPSAVSLFDEELPGAVATPSTANELATNSITMNADTVVAGEYIFVDLEVVDTTHTVASDVGVLLRIEWV